MSVGPRELGYGLDDDDSASKISSEDSGDVRSYLEDSDDDSLSLDLDLDSSSAGQMNLLEEILDSLTTSTVGEQGKLSAAKSLDFFRSMEELDYSGPMKPKPSADCRPSDGAGDEDEGDQRGWNMGQDDSAVHGKHLPPSPRRQPTKSSLKSSKKTPAQSSPVRTPASSAQAQDESNSLSRTPPRYHSLTLGRQPFERHSYVTPPSPALLSGGRTRTISDPQAGPDPPNPPDPLSAPPPPGSTGVLRRKVLPKRPSSPVTNHPATAAAAVLQVPWEKEAKEGGILGLCLGQGTKAVGEAGAQVQGLLEEMGCCVGSSDAQSGPAHCNNHQVKRRAEQ